MQKNTALRNIFLQDQIRVHTQTGNSYNRQALSDGSNTFEHVILEDFVDQIILKLKASTLGFTGYMYDDISDTYFAQAREYMPEVGRFAGRDLLKGEAEIPRSLNEYVYCHNNPIGFVDYDGMKAKTTDDYIKAGADGAIRAGVNKVAIDKVNKEAAKSITKKALAQKVVANKGYSRVTKHVVKNSKAIEKTANSKISTASKLSKFGGGATTVAIDVARGYGEDWASGKTNSKIASNAAVNVGYALAGIGVSAVATPWITTGLVGAGMAAGPAGWVALAIVGAGWGVWTALTSDKVKDWANSLE